MKATSAVTRRDPSLFVFGFSLWSLCNGFSLLATYDTFRRSPIYSVALDLGLSDNLVGAGMVIDSLMLAYILGDRPYGVRAAVLWVTGMFWLFWSAIIFLGGMQRGLYSAAAIWVFVCSIMLVTMAGNRWPKMENS